MQAVIIIVIIFTSAISAKECKIDDYRTTAAIANILNEMVDGANEVYRTGETEEYIALMSAYCPDNLIYAVTVNDNKNQEMFGIVWNNLNEFLHGNTDENLPSSMSAMVDAPTRRIISTPSFYFQCDKDDENQVIASSYYVVQIEDKSSLETAEVINYLETYWKYVDGQWLSTKHIYIARNPFLEYSNNNFSSSSYLLFFGGCVLGSSISVSVCLILASKSKNKKKYQEVDDIVQY